MTGSEASGRSRLEICRPKVTQAKPKTTLFGSTMEKVDSEHTKQMEGIDLDAFEESLKPRKQVRDPPPVLDAEIKDVSKLAAAKQQLEARRRDYDEASTRLNDLENRVRFNPGSLASDVPLPTDIPIKDRPHQWLKTNDLAHSSSINVLGVNPNHRETYNRDIYEPKPPVHAYTLNGDPLNRGVPRTNTRQENAAKNKQSHIELSPMDQKMYVSNYQSHYSKDNDDELDVAGMKLPKNIEHQFGSRVCQSLLSDTEKVTSTLEEQARRRAARRRERSNSDQEKKKVEFSMYENLGNALRHDHFPGLSVDKSGSSMKDNYNQSVYDNRVPGPEQYRYHRDELSTWAESNIIRERMKKAWDDKQQEIAAAKKAL